MGGRNDLAHSPDFHKWRTSAGCRENSLRRHAELPSGKVGEGQPKPKPSLFRSTRLFDGEENHLLSRPRSAGWLIGFEL
jgi:hypothetical protein